MRLTLASVVLMTLAAPAAATVFVGASVDTGASATLGSVKSLKWDHVPTLVPASILAFSQPIISDGVNTAVVQLQSAANWSSPDAGVVSMNWGWTITSGNNGVSALVETGLAPTNWSYSFIATGNGSFDAVYSVTVIGSALGLGQLYGALDLPPGPYGGTFIDPTGSGSFSVPLVAGQAYTFALRNIGNLATGSGFSTQGIASSRLDWTITYAAVPEPATWALMIAGFGSVGFALRRQRLPPPDARDSIPKLTASLRDATRAQGRDRGGGGARLNEPVLGD